MGAAVSFGILNIVPCGGPRADRVFAEVHSKCVVSVKSTRSMTNITVSEWGSSTSHKNLF